MSKFAENKEKKIRPKRNEIKRKKLENERSCDMSIMGIWVRSEQIITGRISRTLTSRPARSQIRLELRRRSLSRLMARHEEEV